MPPRSAGSPERHRTPRGRATAPRPPHMAAQGLIGERTGPNAQARRAGGVERSRPRSPIWREIVERWKPQHDHFDCAYKQPLLLVLLLYVHQTVEWVDGWVLGDVITGWLGVGTCRSTTSFVGSTGAASVPLVLDFFIVLLPEARCRCFGHDESDWSLAVSSLVSAVIDRFPELAFYMTQRQECQIHRRPAIHCELL